MRVLPWLLAITLVAACGGGDSSTTPPPPPGPPPAPPPPPPSTTTVTASIPTSGGLIAWEKPTSSLNGARVTLSAGAFTSSTAWTLEERSTTGWPQRTNVTIAPLGLRISADGGGSRTLGVADHAAGDRAGGASSVRADAQCRVRHGRGAAHHLV